MVGGKKDGRIEIACESRNFPNPDDAREGRKKEKEKKKKREKGLPNWC